MSIPKEKTLIIKIKYHPFSNLVVNETSSSSRKRNHGNQGSTTEPIAFLEPLLLSSSWNQRNPSLEPLIETQRTFIS
ncbi:hypothetical protein QL285_012454 [Trifolium repens]|jgi:hypothetical protein|nr:hypothetical protein QL285_012454 [Trifolium repens]